MIKSLLSFCLMLLLSATVLAQTRQITGKVTEKGGTDPVIAASVTIKGTSGGTQTDVNGNFKLPVPDRAGVVLIFKSVGYTPQEIALTPGQTSVNVALESNSKELDEVVAIGYGTVKRRDVNGSISSVTAKDLKDVPVSSLADALAGRLAGVQITTSDGSPDASVKVLVRGGGSITQSNDPLYVIDGVQVENGLASLSPQDIESIDVLKDAASTAIYGARGANGVIIITTKGGKAGVTRISYNAYVGFKKLARELAVMDPYDFVTYEYERSRGNTQDSTNFANDYGTFANLAQYKTIAPIDWQKRVFGQPAFQQQHNFSITGGDTSTTFNLSFTDDQQNENVINSTYNRKLLNFHFDHKANAKFRMGFNVRYTDQQVNGVDVSSASSSTYNNLRNTVKYIPFTIPGQTEAQQDATLFTESEEAGNNLGLINPITNSNAQFRQNYTYITDLNGYLSYAFNKYITFRSTLGVDLTKSLMNSFDDAVTFNAIINGSSQPLAGVNQLNTNTMDLSNVLVFSNAAANSKRNDINITLGNELYNIDANGINNQFKLFPLGIAPTAALNQLNQGTIIPGYPQNTFYESHLLSFFGRATYSLDKKYSFTATVRADGSSKFAPGHQWGYFPSGSASWRISDEKFMKNVTAVSDLKLRYSYGSSGNNRISDYLTQTLFGTSASGSPVYYPLLENPGEVGYAPQNLVNTKLKWETTISNNIGLDFGLFNNRMTASIDAYRGTTSNLLIQVPVPTSSGYSTQFQNVGKTQNTGLELQLNARILTKRNFTWSANFNVSYNTNKVLALAPGETSYLQNSGWGVSGSPADFIVQVGQPVGSIYGYKSAGFYTTNDFNYNAANNEYTLKPGVVDPSKVIGTAQPGLTKFADINGDGVITTADQTILGNTIPKITGGLNQTFTYKNWDASIFINFQDLVSVLDATKIEFTNGYTDNTNLLAQENNRWRTVDGSGNVIEKIVTVGGSTVAVGSSPDVLNSVNAGAKVPIPITGAAQFYVNSGAVENGAFARLNNVTIGYTFKGVILSRLKISRLRVYVTGNNVALLTGYSGYDPAVNTRTATPVTPGVDYSAYPRAHTYLFGVNLSL